MILKNKPWKTFFDFFSNAYQNNSHVNHVAYFTDGNNPIGIEYLTADHKKGDITIHDNPIESMENLLIKTYHNKIDNIVKNLGQNKTLHCIFYSGAMDIIYQYNILKGKEAFNIIQKSVPQKTDNYVAAGIPINERHISLDVFFATLGKDLGRWQQVYEQIS